VTREKTPGDSLEAFEKYSLDQEMAALLISSPSRTTLVLRNNVVKRSNVINKSAD
jgi:hypothetical protein